MATSVLLVAGLGLAGCSGASSASSGTEASPTGTPVVSPSAARKVIAPTMATNNKANAKLDSALLASFEGGSAFAIDDATYKADKAARFTPPASPFTLDLGELALTRQTTWPATFLAVGTQQPLQKSSSKAATCDAMLDFQKTSASGKWRIVLEPTVNAKGVPKLAKAKAGYAPTVSPATEKLADALPAKVTAALLAEETSGKLGPFSKSDFTGDCWELPNPRADLTEAAEAGYDQRDLFSPIDPPDTQSVALAGGSTLVMFTLRFEDEMISSSDNPVSWGHPSLSKNPEEAWTYFLASGSYSEVKESGELQVAVVLSPGGKKWSVVGSYSGVTSVTGTKAKTSSVPPGTLA